MLALNALECDSQSVVLFLRLWQLGGLDKRHRRMGHSPAGEGRQCAECVAEAELEGWVVLSDERECRRGWGRGGCAGHGCCFWV